MHGAIVAGLSIEVESDHRHILLELEGLLLFLAHELLDRRDVPRRALEEPGREIKSLAKKLFAGVSCI